MRLPDTIERELRALEMGRASYWLDCTSPQRAGVPRLRGLRASIEAELLKLGYRYGKDAAKRKGAASNDYEDFFL